MLTITHTAQCRAIGDLVDALSDQIHIATTARHGHRVSYLLAEAAGPLCAAQSAACAHCHEPS